jgi:guanylate kinase
MSDPSQKVIILTAPSGAGKTSIAQFLLKRFPNLSFSVSATTRAPRGGETDGVEYHFISLAKFEGLIYQNEFLLLHILYHMVDNVFQLFLCNVYQKQINILRKSKKTVGILFFF